MPRPPRDPGDAADRAREIIANSTDLAQIQVAQATLLPLMGLTLGQTAQAIGRDRYWVSRARNRFIRGEPISKQGGRRNAYLSVEREAELIEEAIVEKGMLWMQFDADTLRQLLMKHIKAKSRIDVSESAITDMLDRYARRYVPGTTWGALRGKQHSVMSLAMANHERRQAREKPGG